MKSKPTLATFNMCFYGVWILAFLYELSRVSCMIIITCVLCSPICVLILMSFLLTSKRTLDEVDTKMGIPAILIIFPIYLLGFKDSIVRVYMKSIHNLSSYQNMLTRIPDHNWNPNPFHFLDYYHPWGIVLFIFWIVLQTVILRFQYNCLKRVHEVKASIPAEILGLLHKRNKTDEETNPENLNCGICLDPMYEDEDLLVSIVTLFFQIRLYS